MRSSPEDARRLHPRVAVSGLCFPTLSAVGAIAGIGGLGVSKTSMTSAKLRESGIDAVVDACRAHRVEVVTTTASLGFDLSAEADSESQLERAKQDIDQAAAVGATSVYSLTGRGLAPDWAANAGAYAKTLGPLVDYAAARAVSIAVEPANWLYADLTFVHTFRDALALVSDTGLKVCLDLFHVWTEGTLRSDIENNIELITHVQVSDMDPGARSLPCRAVPGDGHVPIEAVLRWLLDAGYEGVFDLELSGPRIDEIGHTQAAARGAAWLDAVLVGLGA
jgi:sugar phosphate isomerase/epimerase